MRIISVFLILVILLSFAACSSDPPPADTSGDTTADTAPAETTEAPETEPPAPAEPADYMLPIEYPSADGAFTVTLSAPTAVYQGAVGDQTWGHYQFPSLNFTPEGFILANWSYSSDTIDYKPAPAGAVTKRLSVNGGKSWMIPTALDKAAPKNLMGNGKYFNGFGGRAAHKVSYLFDYEPVMTWGEGFNTYKRFFVEDLLGDEREDALKDTVVTASVYDPETKKNEGFACVINWPYAPLTQHPGNKAYPLTQTFALCNGAVKIIDGDPYIAMYTGGFDSFADSREEAVYKYAEESAVYVFHSPDYGVTWNLISQVLMTDETHALATERTGSCEGFDEPMMEVMPDGSVVMLMRTGSDNPCFITRSTDKCRTWSEPVVFDDIGVLPQIVTLDCGVTLSSYGRPEMRFRITDDPAGIEWEDSITIPTAKAGKSCYYTDILPLSENTALFIYSDFFYPNKEGKGVRTILVRTVTVEKHG